jgi:hypothetical protein
MAEKRTPEGTNGITSTTDILSVIDNIVYANLKMSALAAAALLAVPQQQWDRIGASPEQVKKTLESLLEGGGSSRSQRTIFALFQAQAQSGKNYLGELVENLERNAPEIAAETRIPLADLFEAVDTARGRQFQTEPVGVGSGSTSRERSYGSGSAR